MSNGGIKPFFFFPRDLLAKYFANHPRLLHAFESQAQAVGESQAASVAATDALDAATVLTLSPNAAFSNEYVLGPGDGTEIEATPGRAKINVDDTVARATGGKVVFQAPADVVLSLPNQGTLLSDAEPMNAPRIVGLVNAASDAAAAAAGVPVSGIYHNAGALRVRLV
jgi:hypothetical protein